MHGEEDSVLLDLARLLLCSQLSTTQQRGDHAQYKSADGKMHTATCGRSSCTSLTILHQPKLRLGVPTRLAIAHCMLCFHCTDVCTRHQMRCNARQWLHCHNKMCRAREGACGQARGLAHKGHWQGPLGQFFERFGAVKASPMAAFRLLRQGEAVLLYPGGAKEVCHDKHILA